MAAALADLDDGGCVPMNFKTLGKFFWSLSAITFVLGFYIGMNVDAPIGAALWVVSMICALAPFASHRNQTKE